MADQQYRALSSSLVIVFLMVIVKSQKNGPGKGKFIVVTQLIYELKRYEFHLAEIENMYSVSIESYKHEWKFGRTRKMPWERDTGGFQKKIVKYHNIIWFYQLG